MSKTIISCVGDSITWGAGSTDPETISWPAQMQNILGSEFEVLNFGNSGRSLMSTTAEPYFADEMATHSLNSNPDIILFMLGTNDAQKLVWDTQLFEHEYPLAIEQYVKLPSEPKVYLMTPPRSYHLCTGDTWHIDNELIVDSIIPCITKTAKAYGLEIIDVYSFTDCHREFFIEDGVHPNDHGYTQLAKYISGRLAESLNL